MCLCMVICVVAGSGLDDVGLLISQMEEGVGMCLCVVICVVARSGLDDIGLLISQMEGVGTCVCVW